MTTTATFNGLAQPGALVFLDARHFDPVLRAHREALVRDGMQALVPRGEDYIRAHLSAESGHATVGLWDRSGQSLDGMAFFDLAGKSCAIQGVSFRLSTSSLRDALIETFRAHASAKGCDSVVARCKAGNDAALATFLNRGLHIESFDNGRARPVYNLRGPVVLPGPFAAAARDVRTVAQTDYVAQQALLRQGYAGTRIGDGRMILKRQAGLSLAA